MNNETLVDIPPDIMDSLRRIINTSNNNIANISQAQKEQHTPPTVDFVKSLTPLFELIQ